MSVYDHKDNELRRRTSSDNLPASRGQSGRPAVQERQLPEADAEREADSVYSVRRNGSASVVSAGTKNAASSAQMKRRQKVKEEAQMKRRRKSVIIVMVEMVMCLALFIGCYFVNLFTSYAREELDPSVYRETTTARRNVEPTEPRTTIVEETNEQGEVIGTVEVTIPPDEISLTGYRNILLLGLDARSQYNMDQGVQTDVMVIVSINNDTGDIKMASVLRDTILKMEEGTSNRAYDKANSQFAQTGISDTVSMLNRNLGLDINDYVIFNWYGVATCVNQLGGLEVTIPNEMILNYFNGYLTDVNEKTGIWAPQLTTPGTYNMSGTQVVAFCRIRYGGYNDTGRTANQREVIEKAFQKAKALLAAGEISQLLNIAQTGLGNVKTNLNLTEILSMAMDLNSYSMAGSYQFPQNYQTGKYLGNYKAKYNIDDALCATDFATEVRQLHYFLFNDPYYEPSPFIQNISYQMYLDMNGL